MKNKFAILLASAGLVVSVSSLSADTDVEDCDGASTKHSRLVSVDDQSEGVNGDTGCGGGNGACGNNVSC